MSNMPVLWRNALDGLATEGARKAWIWFAESRSNCPRHYDADTYALEVDRLFLALSPMVKAAADVSRRLDGREIDTETLSDLMRFILTRHANERLGGNITPGWLKECPR